jgi:hypothetical protein
VTVIVLAVLDPPTWVMPTIALLGPLLTVVLTLFFRRNRP